MRVTAEGDLGVLTDLIHDLWFRLDSVEHDEATRSIVIPFKNAGMGSSLVDSLVSKPRGGEGPPRASLVVRNVESVHIRDTEKVGDYDFNKLT